MLPLVKLLMLMLLSQLLVEAKDIAYPDPICIPPSTGTKDPLADQICESDCKKIKKCKGGGCKKGGLCVCKGCP
ncbi:unnamed protein product [Cylicocyclus nassatus]|uniref:Uncharacterized protein n=1 Tax=Cylicocyclus nassatus TaxID=53992 RepID=A0AA36HCD7_CYLNA|nr:unnamed protein product [Cylicocyclus nassatus]